MSFKASAELSQLRAAYAELKETSKTLEEGLEAEIHQLEEEVKKKDHTISHLEQSLETLTKKAEQAREYSNRHQLSLEKQVQAYEASMKRLREDYRRLEQRCESSENACRVVQSQTEEIGENLEAALSREAILRLEMDDVETRLNLRHELELTKMKNEQESLEMRLQNDIRALTRKLSQGVATEEPPPHIELESQHSQVKQAALLFLNKQLREKLATSDAELGQAKKRLAQLEAAASPPPMPAAAPQTPHTAAAAGPRGSGVMEGYLQKRGDGPIPSWKKLLFKVNPERHSLDFFFVQLSQHATMMTKLGELWLPGAAITEGKDNTFEIQPRFSKKTYVLQAASAEERAKWLQVLTRHAAKKLIAGSICEDWLNVGTREDNCQRVYCALFKDSFQYYNDPKDLRPVQQLQLVDTILVERISERPVLGLDYGPGIESERYFVDCGTDEKHAAWLHEFFLLLGRKRGETRVRSDSVARSVSREPGGLARNLSNVGSVETELHGRLSQFDTHTQKWVEYYYVLSREDGLLKNYSVASGGQGEPLGVLPLLHTRQDGVIIAAIITNYPAAALANRDHFFGITPPYSNLTRVFEAKTDADMLLWLDGLVSFLDSKVARDPYSTEEGYMYLQKQHKRTVEYKKKYVILSLPTLKYYKPGSYARAKSLFLTPDSKVVLQTPPKKFAFAFSVHTAEAKEMVWTCKVHAEGEKWVAAIQAAIVKLRTRPAPAPVQPAPLDFLGLSKVTIRASDPSTKETFVLKPVQQRVAARSSRLRSASLGPRDGVVGPPPPQVLDASPPMSLTPAAQASQRRKWW